MFSFSTNAPKKSEFTNCIVFLMTITLKMRENLNNNEDTLWKTLLFTFTYILLFNEFFPLHLSPKILIFSLYTLDKNYRPMKASSHIKFGVRVWGLSIR